MYSSFALDTETGTLYSPTGNPGPDFVASYRLGDNLYTCSIVMLDARTAHSAAITNWSRTISNDWDLAASPILFTSRSGRKMVAVGGKNGYLYGLDRDLKNVLYTVPVTRIENIDARSPRRALAFSPVRRVGSTGTGPRTLPR